MMLSASHRQLTAQHSLDFHTSMTGFSYTAQGKGPPVHGTAVASQVKIISTSNHTDFTTFKHKKQMNFMENYFLCFVFSHYRKEEDSLLNLHLQAVHLKAT